MKYQPSVEINSANHNLSRENKDNKIQTKKKRRNYKRRSQLLTLKPKKHKKEQQLIGKKKKLQSKGKVWSKNRLKLKIKERKVKLKTRQKHVDKVVENGSDEENKVD